MKAEQNLRISLSDFPFGSKSAPIDVRAVHVGSGIWVKLTSLAPTHIYYVYVSDGLHEYSARVVLDSHPVKAFLNICSKPKNLRMDRLTVG